ncbi:MAG: hypothetical protein M3R16_00835 [Pseudomonadota bacterium]|nr:hypothetical protein [Pseudomonadota bacterium]
MTTPATLLQDLPPDLQAYVRGLEAALSNFVGAMADEYDHRDGSVSSNIWNAYDAAISATAKGDSDGD